MAGRVIPLTASEQTLAAAAAAFLAQPSLARSTRRSYDQTLTRLVHELGGDRPLSMLTAEAVVLTVTTAWGARAPATWNRHVATVRSFLGFCRRRRWIGEDLAGALERRPEPSTAPRPSSCPNWSDCGVATRSGSATRRCGDSCTRRPHAPPKP
jgi:site-specific recombinase XerD